MHPHAGALPARVRTRVPASPQTHAQAHAHTHTHTYAHIAACYQQHNPHITNHTRAKDKLEIHPDLTGTDIIARTHLHCLVQKTAHALTYSLSLSQTHTRAHARTHTHIHTHTSRLPIAVGHRASAEGGCGGNGVLQSAASCVPDQRDVHPGTAGARMHMHANLCARACVCACVCSFTCGAGPATHWLRPCMPLRTSTRACAPLQAGRRQRDQHSHQSRQCLDDAQGRDHKRHQFSSSNPACGAEPGGAAGRPWAHMCSWWHMCRSRAQCAHACVFMRVRACVRTCGRVCVCECACAHVCPCASAGPGFV